jgi:hypothetical protein
VMADAPDTIWGLRPGMGFAPASSWLGVTGRAPSGRAHERSVADAPQVGAGTGDGGLPGGEEPGLPDASSRARRDIFYVIFVTH